MICAKERKEMNKIYKKIQKQTGISMFTHISSSQGKTYKSHNKLLFLDNEGKIRYVWKL